MSNQPHAVCIPFPAQGHINPMLKFAKILNSKGFHITFINTEYNHRRYLKAWGPAALDGLPSFRFETIPDGLPPPENLDVTQDIPSLLKSTSQTCLAPFKEVISKLNTTEGIPPVSCVVSDGVLSFTLDAAEELGIPEVLFWTTSACGFLCYAHFATLMERGLIPLKDPADLTNGYLNRTVDCIPSMKGIRLKDIPTFCRTTDPQDFIMNLAVQETSRAKNASAIVLNTFDELEPNVLSELSSMYTIYPIGPLHMITDKVENEDLKALGSSLWKEDTECLEWLNTKEPNSVIYVNFGSITIMTSEQLLEFSWGLANSKQNFLWVIRPDLVCGNPAVLPAEFVAETSGRGMLASWVTQEEVLRHTSVGGFLTHCGWNSTVESLSSGVPMICWPFFSEQQTNCWYVCDELGIGMEIDSDVKRDEVEKLVRVLMVEEKGEEMRKLARVWKKKAETMSSLLNIENLINQVLLSRNK